MATEIHAFGADGALSPGAEEAFALYGPGGGGATTLNGLSDVDTSGRTTGDVLKFNGTQWIADVPGEGSSLYADLLDAPTILVPEDATAGEINTLISEAPDGAIIDFGPYERTLNAPIIVGNGVHLRGGWTINGTSVSGTRLIFPDAVDTSDGAIQIRYDYVTATGIYVTGVGTVSGSIGWHIVGESLDFTHGVRLIQCGAALFDYGAMNGEWSDHNSFAMCKFSGNNHGVGFAPDNNYDFDFISCFLEGNTHCSSHLAADTALANTTFIRCHLGFSQYGVFQEASTNGAGYAGLTLIDSPIENVTVQHIRIEYGGNIWIQGGYWLWSGTPANPAVYVKELNTGHIHLVGVRLEPATPNANSPALVNVVANAPGNEVDISVRLAGFAQAEYSGSAPAIVNNRPTNRVYRQGASQGIAWDAAGLYLDTPGVNVIIRDSSASYVTRMRWWAAGNQLIVNSIALGAAGATGGPSWTFGAGAPSGSQPNGSFYSRTDGGAGSTIYARVAGAWVAIA